MKIVVMGGGVAGLSAALALSRDGHTVTLLERDDLSCGPDHESAWEWNRRGIPHFLQPHAFLPRGDQILRERFGDVHSALLGAGAEEMDLAANVPGEREPGDEELRPLGARRPLIEWGLRRAVAAEPNVSVRAGARVTGLTFAGSPPRATGVKTGDGDIEADFVVDALGRTSPLPRWIAATGSAAPSEERSDCGMVYYARYYRLRPGKELPKGPWLLSPRADLGYCGAVTFFGDNGTFAGVFGVPPGDRGLKRLREEGPFERAIAAVPVVAAWANPELAEPITPVLVMGSLQNTLRTYVSDGTPAVRGLAAVADALCHTNPAYALGLSLSLIHALALADALREHAADPEVAYFEATYPLLRERFDAAVAIDEGRARLWAGEPIDFLRRDGHRALFTLIAPMIAGLADPEVARKALRRWGLLDSLKVLDDDEVLLERIEKTAASRLQAAPPPPPIPREELLRVMSG